MTSNTFAMSIENDTMYSDTFTIYVDTFNMCE
jgi:hypothetical protein